MRKPDAKHVDNYLTGDLDDDPVPMVQMRRAEFLKIMRVVRASEIIAAHHTLGLSHKESDMENLTDAFYEYNKKPKRKRA